MQILFEGIPTYPDAGRWWELVDKYQVSQASAALILSWCSLTSEVNKLPGAGSWWTSTGEVNRASAPQIGWVRCQVYIALVLWYYSTSGSWSELADKYQACVQLGRVQAFWRGAS